MKEKLRLTDVAADLTKMILKSISEESLEKLEEWDIYPDNEEQKLEILILSLYTLRVSAQEGLRHVQKNYVALLFYTEQQIKATYVVSNYGTSDQFETTLQERYREYDSIMESNTSEDKKLQRIGLAFADKIGSKDPALMYWASRTFTGGVEGYGQFLRNLDSQFELVTDGSEIAGRKDNAEQPPATQQSSSKDRVPIYIAFGLIVFAIFAIFIWPTRFMYEHMGIGEGGSLIVRIDRFTGEAEWLLPNQGWAPIKSPKPSDVPIDPFASPTPKQ